MCREANCLCIHPRTRMFHKQRSVRFNIGNKSREQTCIIFHLIANPKRSVRSNRFLQGNKNCHRIVDIFFCQLRGEQLFFWMTIPRPNANAGIGQIFCRIYRSTQGKCIHGFLCIEPFCNASPSYFIVSRPITVGIVAKSKQPQRVCSIYIRQNICRQHIRIISLTYFCPNAKRIEPRFHLICSHIVIIPRIREFGKIIIHRLIA